MAVERLLEKGRKEAREAMGVIRKGSFDSEDEGVVKQLRSVASSHSVTEGETDGEEALTTGDEGESDDKKIEKNGYVAGEEEQEYENEEELAREQLLSDLAALDRSS